MTPLWQLYCFWAGVGLLAAVFLLPVARTQGSEGSGWRAVLWLIAFALLTQVFVSPSGVGLQMPSGVLDFDALLGDYASPIVLGGYAVAGFVWAITHLALYARRIGQQYVLIRDEWLRKNDFATVASIPVQYQAVFKEAVSSQVRTHLTYGGDFPLRPLQHVRMLITDWLYWPLTLLGYLFGRVLLDLAQQVWFAIRGWVEAYWRKTMVELLSDQAWCLRTLERLELEQSAARSVGPAINAVGILDKVRQRARGRGVSL